MKKIVKYFMMVIALCIFALTANSFSMAEASALYTPASYWNNDTNYPLAFSQNGVNRYVDLSSAKIIEQEEKVEENTGVILRQFRCKKCHELVTVVNKHDRRTIFCSPRCEKLYWKHPKKIINKN